MIDTNVVWSGLHQIILFSIHAHIAIVFGLIALSRCLGLLLDVWQRVRLLKFGQHLVKKFDGTLDFVATVGQMRRPYQRKDYMKKAIELMTQNTKYRLTFMSNVF